LPAPDPSGGFGSASGEPTNILGNGIGTLNDATAVADTVSSVVAEGVNDVLSESVNSTVAEGVNGLLLERMSSGVVEVGNDSLSENLSGAVAEIGNNLLIERLTIAAVEAAYNGANQLNAGLINASQIESSAKMLDVGLQATSLVMKSFGISDKVSSGVISVLKDSSQIKMSENLFEGITHTTSMFKEGAAANVCSIVNNVTASANNVSEAMFDVTRISTKTICSFAHAVDNGVNNFGKDLTNVLTVETERQELMVNLITVIPDNANLVLTTVGKSLKTDRSGYTIVDRSASRLIFEKANGLDRLVVDYEHVASGAYIIPPAAAPVLEGSAEIFKRTSEEAPSFQRAVESCDSSAVCDYFNMFF
jgi:hypothetical protein